MRKILNTKRPDNPQHADKCECWTALRLTAALSDDRFMPWYMENFIYLMMDHHFCIMHNDSFGSVHALSVFDEPLIINEIYDERNIVGQIIEAINNTGYVSLYYDRFYIKGSDVYGVEHYLHDMLIYGYDDEKREFYFVDYELAPSAPLMAIDFDTLEESFASALKRIRENKEKYSWMSILNLPVHVMYLKPPTPKRQVNLTKIYEAIDSNLRGGEFTCEDFAKDKVLFRTAYKTNKYRYGVSVYRGFEELFGIIKEDKCFRENFYNLFIMAGFIKIYENKQDLIKRLRYISEGENIKLSNNIVRNVEKITEILHSVFESFQGCGSELDIRIIENAEAKLKKAEELDIRILTEARDFVYRLMQQKRLM